MSRKHDEHSPVYDYVRRYQRDQPSGQYLQVKGEPLTQQLVTTPQMKEYLTYIEQGDPRALATALVDGRLGQLQRRRDMINFIRQFIGLPARPLSPAKQIADVTRQLTSLYDQAVAMIAAKNRLADVLIDQATKSGKLDLERATNAAKIAEQERIAAEEQKKTREAQATATLSPQAVRHSEQLATREHRRQLLEKDEAIARFSKSIRDLKGSDEAATSPFKRAAQALGACPSNARSASGK